MAQSVEARARQVLSFDCLESPIQETILRNEDKQGSNVAKAGKFRENQ
jgi:hypothetical protein